jgi:hypothetical protein
MWLLLPIAAGIAALVAFKPMVKESAIKLWRADWTSGEFWHGNIEMPTKPATEVGMGPPTIRSAETPRSSGIGSEPQTVRGDGKTVVGGGRPVNSGPNIDPYPRLQPQGPAQAGDAGPRSKGGSDRPSSPGKKSTPISSAGDAVQNPSTAAPTTTPVKPADNRPGSVEVSINGAAEAEVYIDGLRRGRAPLTWQGPPGKHIVRLRPASTFTPGLIEVTVAPGATVRAVFTSR